MKINPITREELETAQEKTCEEQNKEKAEPNPQRTYYTFNGRSRLVAKWWIAYINEHGDKTTKAFPTSKERNDFIRRLEDDYGYVCDKSQCK